MNSLDGLEPECLGFAGVVYEHVLVGVAFFPSAHVNVM